MVGFHGESHEDRMDSYAGALAAFEASAGYERVMGKHKPWHTGQPQVVFPSAE